MFHLPWVEFPWLWVVAAAMEALVTILWWNSSHAPWYLLGMFSTPHKFPVQISLPSPKLDPHVYPSLIIRSAKRNVFLLNFPFFKIHSQWHSDKRARTILHWSSPENSHLLFSDESTICEDSDESDGIGVEIYAFREKQKLMTECQDGEPQVWWNLNLRIEMWHSIHIFEGIQRNWKLSFSSSNTTYVNSAEKKKTINSQWSEDLSGNPTHYIS